MFIYFNAYISINATYATLRRGPSRGKKINIINFFFFFF